MKKDVKRDLSSEIMIFQISGKTHICEVGWTGDIKRTIITLDYILYP